MGGTKSKAKERVQQEPEAKVQVEPDDKDGPSSPHTSPQPPLKQGASNPRLYFTPSAPSVPSLEQQLRADFQSLEEQLRADFHSLEERVELIEQSLVSQRQDFESCKVNLSNDVSQIHKDFVTKDYFQGTHDAQSLNMGQKIDATIDQRLLLKAKIMSEDLDGMRLTVSQIESAWARVEERLEGALRGLRDQHDLNQESYHREKELQEQIYELAQRRLERESGQLNVRRCCAEWVIPNVRAKADLMPRGTCVTSPAFAVELPAVSVGCRPVRLDGLRLDFYPSGREGSQEGFSSLALRSESGLPWVRYWLAIAGFRRGPLDPLTEIVDDICPLVGALVGESGKEAVRLTVEFIEPQLAPQGRVEVASSQKAKQNDLSNLSPQKLPPFPGPGMAVPQVASLWSSGNRGF